MGQIGSNHISWKSCGIFLGSGKEFYNVTCRESGAFVIFTGSNLTSSERKRET